MISFDIVIDNDPDAVGGFLEYRYIQTDGTPSPWVVNTQIGAPGFGYFPMNSTPTTLLGVTGNPLPGPPDFRPNTVYQFRVKQLCGLDGTELYSSITADYYVPECPIFTVEVGPYDPVLAAFPIDVTVNVAPSSGSVVSYIFDIFDVNVDPTTSIGSIVETSATVENNLPYTVRFDDNNVAGGIVQGNLYEVEITYTVITSGQGVTEICDRKAVIIPICSTWKILTGDAWFVTWLACDGTQLSCGNLQPNNALYVCSPQQPIVYWCDNGIKKPSIIDPGTGLPTKGGLVVLPNQGSCDPSLYNYNPAIPVLNGSVCTTCPL
jgi:hypothetical protein